MDAPRHHESFGGGELANLWPELRTETRNGVTLTDNGNGTYTTSGTWSEWTAFEQKISLDAGTYSIEGTQGLTGFASWDLLLQIVPSSGSAVIKPGIPVALITAGEYRCQLCANNQTAIGRTVTPNLTRID